MKNILTGSKNYGKLTPMKLNNQINSERSPWLQQIETIIYQEFPDADWATILEKYKDENELFLEALEGAYKTKHQDGFDSLDKLNEFSAQNRQAIFSKIEEVKAQKRAQLN